MENKFFDRITVVISAVCVIAITVTGSLFLKLENENKSSIIKSDDSVIIEEQIDSALKSANSYDASLYGLININTATKEELMLLENIGSSRADSIISYRATTPFKKVSDIKKVNGIGDGIYKKIKDKISVE